MYYFSKQIWEGVTNMGHKLHRFWLNTWKIEHIYQDKACDFCFIFYHHRILIKFLGCQGF
jgi:hypothetical protein